MLEDKSCSECWKKKLQYRQASFYAISSLAFVLTRLENLHFSNLRDNFRFNAIWYWRSLARTSLALEASRKWRHCHVPNHVCGLGNTITRLIWFPLQPHWLLLTTWLRNVNLHYLVQSKLKISIEEKLDITSGLTFFFYSTVYSQIY